MTTDLSFSRRSLISNENKYRQSLEYKMFLAENPGYKQNQTMAAAPSVQFRNLQQEDHHNAANFPSLSGANSPQNLSQTFDLGPQKTLLNREKQFLEYAPVFNKPDPYDVRPSIGGTSSNQYTSTIDSRLSRAPSARPSRWQSNGGPVNASLHAYDDLNDRENAFDLDQAMRGQQAAGVGSGLVSNQPQTPYRQAVSSVRQAPPRSQLVTSAKMQMGGQPQATLHASASSYQNPLIGFSESDTQRKVYQQEYMKFALSQAEGSINDVKERSRSKSRRAKYEARRHTELGDQESSLVDIMNRTRAHSPNRLAMKQRYAYSRAGQQARIGSADMTRHGDVSIADQSSIHLNQGQILHDPNTSFARQSLPVNGARPAYILNQGPQPKVIDIGSELANQPDILEREHRKAEYKQQLIEQINEKKEKDRLAKLADAAYDVRLTNDYANYYRIGALRQGGGSPIRGQNGEIISQHVPFSSQSQHNGGVEVPEEQGYADRHLGQPNIGAQSSFGQTFNQREQENLKGTMQASFSPKRQEIMHMKPSNQFEDITEDEFNKREQDKKAYQNELMHQMEEAKAKKMIEKDRRMRQDVDDDRKIHQALDQMNEAFRKEENPNYRDNNNNYRSESQLSQGRSILKSREKSNSRIQMHQQQPPSSHANQSMQMQQMTPELGYHQPAPQADYFNSGNTNYSPPRVANTSVDEQLERLRRVQEEIEQKNSIDRFETEKIFKDLLDSNRKLSMAMQLDSSPFQMRNLPQHIGVTQLTSAKPRNGGLGQNMSGNIRLESQFTRLPSQQPLSSHLTSNASPKPSVEGLASVGRVTEQLNNSAIGAPSASIAGSTQNRSAIGRLDELIDDFSKPAEDKFDER